MHYHQKMDLKLKFRVVNSTKASTSRRSKNQPSAKLVAVVTFLGWTAGVLDSVSHVTSLPNPCSQPNYSIVRLISFGVVVVLVGRYGQWWQNFETQKKKKKVKGRCRHPTVVFTIEKEEIEL